jgi:hypothetical protein
MGSNAQNVKVAATVSYGMGKLKLFSVTDATLKRR